MKLFPYMCGFTFRPQIYTFKRTLNQYDSMRKTSFIYLLLPSHSWTKAINEYVVSCQTFPSPCNHITNQVYVFCSLTIPSSLLKIILESHNIQNKETCWTHPHVDLLYSLSITRYILRELDLDLYVWLVLNLNYMFDTCLFGMLPMGLLTLNYYQT